MSGKSDELNRELPWLVNHSLPESERRALEEELAGDPELQAERDFLAGLRDSLQREAANAAAPSPGEMGWQRLQRSIRKDQGARRRDHWWRGLAVAASLLLVVQTSVVWRQSDYAEGYRVMGETGAPRLQVRFRDEASMQQIRQLLGELNLRIIDGPSAAGLYRLEPVGDADPATALAGLRAASELVAHAAGD